MTARIPVFALARELYVKPNDVMGMAKDVGIRVVRVASTLTPSQADKVRKRAAEKDSARERRRREWQKEQVTPSSVGRNRMTTQIEPWWAGDSAYPEVVSQNQAT